jgi:dihydrofolate reductase
MAGPRTGPVFTTDAEAWTASSRVESMTAQHSDTKRRSMSKVRFHISVSLDGFVAGPDQSEDHPLGVGGEDLHEWVVGLEAWRRQHGLEGGEGNPSTPVVEEAQSNVGATIMGRNMFGGGPGPWSQDPPWNGWWGDDPPFHTPVYVLTHHPREPLEMKGGTTLLLRDRWDRGGPRASEASRRWPGCDIGGGADVIQQYLAAGFFDEFELHVVPVLLGAGERLLQNVGHLTVEQVRAIDAPGVTHIKYRVVK